MSSASSPLQSGIEALKQGRYSEATDLLERCLATSAPNSKESIRAQMSLATAYRRTGQVEKALVLCQQLTKSSNPQIQAWAQQALQALDMTQAASQTPSVEASAITSPIPEPQSVTSSSWLTAEQANDLLKTGASALKAGNFSEAIQALEAFCQGTPPDHKDYSQAQIWLVKAYKNNKQYESAIALCRQLTTAQDEMVRTWAQQFILGLNAIAVIQTAAVQPESLAQGVIAAITPIQPGSTSTVTEPTTTPPFRMKTLTEMKKFYQDYLLKDLQAVEANRLSILRTIMLTTVGVVALISISALAIKFAALPSKLLFFAIGIGLIIWVSAYSACTTAYSMGFKSKIIAKIVHFIDENLRYSERDLAQTTKTAFLSSKLFQNKATPNQFKQDDCVSGAIGDTPIFFSAIHAEDEVTHLRDWGRDRYDIFFSRDGLVYRVFTAFFYAASRIFQGQRLNFSDFLSEVLGETSRTTVFKGLFFIADFNKNFRGNTVVLPDRAERTLGQLGSMLQSMNKTWGQLVKLEDPEFEKLFVVYSWDQIEARYLLSTSLMERLVKFQKKANRDIYVSFIDHSIYIAVEYVEDLFEPKVFRTMLSFKPIQEYFEALTLAIGIVEDLNLNRRIWSK